MHRNTYVEINLSNITNNVKKIINKLSGFKYYFGVVKADCYGHNNIETVNAIINGGCNYLTVATLDEALEIRKFNTTALFYVVSAYDKFDYAKEAIDYLQKRNISWYLIDYYNIGYVPYWSKDKEMRNRIVIPSYDEFGELNYFVARDYTGKRKLRKYNNPDIKKTDFVFNEDKINWYEYITLVEGAFDHMVVPNSIPLLGKTLKRDYATFNTVITKAKANVNVLLDDDALNDAKKIYKLLSSTNLKGRVRLIECPDGYDASDIYQKFGKKGIRKLMQRAKEIEEFELVSVAV